MKKATAKKVAREIDAILSCPALRYGYSKTGRGGLTVEGVNKIRNVLATHVPLR